MSKYSGYHHPQQLEHNMNTASQSVFRDNYHRMKELPPIRGEDSQSRDESSLVPQIRGLEELESLPQTAIADRFIDVQGSLVESFRFAVADHTGEIISIYDRAELSLIRYIVGAQLAEQGYEPQHWVKSAQNDPNCPEYIREYVDRGEEDKLDALALDYIDVVATERSDNQEAKVVMISKMLEDFYCDRLPNMPQCATQDYIHDVIDSAQYEIEPMGAFKRYLDTVRAIGQDKARWLYEATGVVHFSGWSTRALEGTYNLLVKGHPESGNDVTIMIKGTTGDHNNVLEQMRYIESDDVIVAEVCDTNGLVQLTETLQRAELDRHVQQIVLAGHGSEERFTLSATDRISADADSWADNDGVSAMVKTLQPENLILVSCHPLVHEEGSEFAAIDDIPQPRRGTAPAISEAFPELSVISGLDGPVAIVDHTGGQFGIRTDAISQADAGKINRYTPAHPHLALTRNGKTRRYPHNHITV